MLAALKLTSLAYISVMTTNLANLLNGLNAGTACLTASAYLAIYSQALLIFRGAYSDYCSDAMTVQILLVSLHMHTWPCTAKHC